MQQLTLLFPATKTTAYPKTHLESVIYFMARLDIDMVGTLLDENKIYQDFPKKVFVNKLHIAFDAFIAAGDKQLAVYKGCCKGCSKGCSGVTFLGAQGHYIDVLFIMDGPLIKDIYDCANFVNEQYGLPKAIQVSID